MVGLFVEEISWLYRVTDCIATNKAALLEIKPNIASTFKMENILQAMTVFNDFEVNCIWSDCQKSSKIYPEESGENLLELQEYFNTTMVVSHGSDLPCSS